MDEIVAEIGSALDWLIAKLPALDGDPEKLLLSGWSAGAQLAAMTMDHPSVRGCLAISGIYDLEPMRHCYVNDKLGLDEATALRNSPIRLQPSSEGSARRRGWRHRASADAATIRRLCGGALPARTTCAAPRNSRCRPFFHSRRDGAERRPDCRYPARVASKRRAVAARSGVTFTPSRSAILPARARPAPRCRPESAPPCRPHRHALR